MYIREGSLLTCSDGSHEPEIDFACQAWVFADSTGHILWCGFGPTDGNPSMLSSYRSELAGITELLFLIQLIVQHLEITTGTVTLFCDNTSALGNVFDLYPKRGIYPMLQRDYDMLGMARKVWKELPITVISKHVKGHYKGENREVQHDLNDLADRMAEQFQLNPPQGFHPRKMPLLHPEHEATLYYEGSIVTTAFRDIVYKQVFTKLLQQNIMKKDKWTKQQLEQIAWEAYGAAFRGKLFFAKYRWQNYRIRCGTQGRKSACMAKTRKGYVQYARRS